MQSVLFDIKEDAYLAGVRALGIVDKIITGPFWRVMEQKGKNSYECYLIYKYIVLVICTGAP